MEVTVVEASPHQVVLSAPLAPNINHRDTVFGGSASAVAILAAWSMLHLRLSAEGLGSRLVIQRNTMDYLEGTGRSKDEMAALKAYFKAQGMYGIPKKGDIDYSQVVELDLATVRPSVSGPKQPEERINLEGIGARIVGLCDSFDALVHDRPWRSAWRIATP